MILKTGNAQAEIEPLGAYVASWTIGDKPIFFQKTVLSGKTRGGCHLCFPNFDNGDQYGLPNHGYARLVDWQIVKNTPNSVELEIIRENDLVPAEYRNLEANLIYKLAETSLEMTLKVKNNGAESLNLDPAFHPYFNNDAPLYVIHQQNLPVTLVWSDNLGNYFCAEPTANGKSFSGDNTPNIIKQGEENLYQIRISL
ncbi:MAG: hypothetical protein LBM97_01910 [Candidatus Nomurabacteria bacterium]|jgi:D-hexose-6-phosphate mutarotase|nr:hypothetical protein [Candidatus Nomurabacteria bacterium]